jgi:hypothetical protein
LVGYVETTLKACPTGRPFLFSFQIFHGALRIPGFSRFPSLIPSAVLTANRPARDAIRALGSSLARKIIRIPNKMIAPFASSLGAPSAPISLAQNPARRYFAV